MILTFEQLRKFFPENEYKWIWEKEITPISLIITLTIETLPFHFTVEIDECLFEGNDPKKVWESDDEYELEYDFKRFVEFDVNTSDYGLMKLFEKHFDNVKLGEN